MSRILTIQIIYPKVSGAVIKGSISDIITLMIAVWKSGVADILLVLDPGPNPTKNLTGMITNPILIGTKNNYDTLYNM